MKPIKRIDEELVCVDALVHRLKQGDRHRTVEVEREKNDPPDFWLTVDRERLAVEVTSIVANAGYAAQCKAFKDAVHEVAASRGNVEGTYAIIMRRHLELPRRGSNRWSALINEASSFILSSPGSPLATEHLLCLNKQGHLEVARLSLSGSEVGIIRNPGGKWAVEAEEEIACLMRKAIEKKRQRLQKKAIAGLNTILAFYDAYAFGDVASARKALTAVTGYEWFHSIFWAASFTDRPNGLSPDNPGRLGWFLYSRDASWARNGRSN